MTLRGSINFLPHVEWLKGRASNTYTQFGEDGLIAATLERIGIENTWCFEVGASDGVVWSNTKLLREQGWQAVLIEADVTLYGQLESKKCYNETIWHATIDAAQLEHLLAKSDCPLMPDLGVIDIDGEDYNVWQGMQTYRPRVMLVEKFPADENADINGQAGRTLLLELAEDKGYTCVADTFCNMLFVADECLN